MVIISVLACIYSGAQTQLNIRFAYWIKCVTHNKTEKKKKNKGKKRENRYISWSILYYSSWSWYSLRRSIWFLFKKKRKCKNHLQHGYIYYFPFHFEYLCACLFTVSSFFGSPFIISIDMWTWTYSLLTDSYVKPLHEENNK